MANKYYLSKSPSNIYFAKNAVGHVQSAGPSLLTVINAIKATGVHFEFGPYAFDYGTDLPTFDSLNDMVFKGQGIGVTVIQNSTNAASDSEPFSMRNCNRCYIGHMDVSAGGTSRTTSDAIDFDAGLGAGLTTNDNLVERVRILASRARGIVFDGKDATPPVAQFNTIRDCIVAGALILDDGIELLGASYNTVENCVVRDVGGHGLQMSKSSGAGGIKSNHNKVKGGTFLNNGKDGINILSSDYNIVEGAHCLNNAHVSASKDGIRVEIADAITADFNTFKGNVCTDDQGTKTQRYGINIGNATINNTIVVNNQLEGNLTAGLFRTGSVGALIDNNPGYVAHNSGAAASVADGGTISHGLAATPTNVRITGSVAAQVVSVTALGATTFTVAIKTLAGLAGTTQTIYWEAEV